MLDEDFGEAVFGADEVSDVGESEGSLAGQSSRNELSSRSTWAPPLFCMCQTSTPAARYGYTGEGEAVVGVEVSTGAAVEPAIAATGRPTRQRVSALGGTPTGARAGFRVAEWVAPHLAAVAAQKVWFRVPPAPPLQRRDRGVRPGESLAVDVAGRPLHVLSWGSGPVVLLVHGWSGWWQQLSVYVEPLVAAGMRVVAWDAPSHGDSAPGRYGSHASSIADLVDGVRAVSAAVGEVYGVVAHSAGAMAACMNLVEGLSAKRVVLVSPSVSGADQVDFLTERLGWGPRTLRLVQRFVRRRFHLDMADYDVPQRLLDCGVALPDALLVHDLDDLQAPPDSADRLAAVWPNATILTTTGHDHFRVLWDPNTVRRAVSFIATGPPILAMQ